MTSVWTGRRFGAQLAWRVRCRRGAWRTSGQILREWMPELRLRRRWRSKLGVGRYAALLVAPMLLAAVIGAISPWGLAKDGGTARSLLETGLQVQAAGLALVAALALFALEAADRKLGNVSATDAIRASSFPELFLVMAGSMLTTLVALASHASLHGHFGLGVFVVLAVGVFAQLGGFLAAFAILRPKTVFEYLGRRFREAIREHCIAQIRWRIARSLVQAEVASTGAEVAHPSIFRRGSGPVTVARSGTVLDIDLDIVRRWSTAGDEYRANIFETVTAEHLLVATPRRIGTQGVRELGRSLRVGGAPPIATREQAVRDRGEALLEAARSAIVRGDRRGLRDILLSFTGAMLEFVEVWKSIGQTFDAAAANESTWLPTGVTGRLMEELAELSIAAMEGPERRCVGELSHRCCQLASDAFSQGATALVTQSIRAMERIDYVALSAFGTRAATIAVAHIPNELERLLDRFSRPLNPYGDGEPSLETLAAASEPITTVLRALARVVKERVEHGDRSALLDALRPLGDAVSDMQLPQWAYRFGDPLADAMRELEEHRRTTAQLGLWTVALWCFAAPKDLAKRASVAELVQLLDDLGELQRPVQLLPSWRLAHRHGDERNEWWSMLWPSHQRSGWGSGDRWVIELTAFLLLRKGASTGLGDLQRAEPSELQALLAAIDPVLARPEVRSALGDDADASATHLRTLLTDMIANAERTALLTRLNTPLNPTSVATFERRVGEIVTERLEGVAQVFPPSSDGPLASGGSSTTPVDRAFFQRDDGTVLDDLPEEIARQATVAVLGKWINSIPTPSDTVCHEENLLDGIADAARLMRHEVPEPCELIALTSIDVGFSLTVDVDRRVDSGDYLNMAFTRMAQVDGVPVLTTAWHTGDPIVMDVTDVQLAPVARNALIMTKVRPRVLPDTATATVEQLKDAQYVPVQLTLCELTPPTRVVAVTASPSPAPDDAAARDVN